MILTGSLPGIYAFEGNNTTAFWRYGTVLNNWTTKTNAPANVKQGGALAYDGTFIYGFEGNGKKLFWQYNISANTWSALASTDTNVSSGGSLLYLNVGETDYIFALLGGSKEFRRYKITPTTGWPWRIRHRT